MVFEEIVIIDFKFIQDCEIEPFRLDLPRIPRMGEFFNCDLIDQEKIPKNHNGKVPGTLYVSQIHEYVSTKTKQIIYYTYLDVVFMKISGPLTRPEQLLSNIP